MHISMSMDGKSKLNRRPLGARQGAPSARDLALFVEAAMAVGLSSLAIKLPFRRLVPLMSFKPPAKRKGNGTAEEIVRAVDRASRRLPWKTVCFQQGLAVHWMLRRRNMPSILHYGLQTGDDALRAHVWVTLDQEVLIGGEEAGRHAVVASFPEN